MNPVPDPSRVFALAARRVFILLLIVNGHAFADSDGWSWRGKAGLNYDFISQDYYLRTIDTLGITDDSLSELKSYSDRIDEKGVNLRLELLHKGNMGFSLANNAYVTDEKLRNRVNLQFKWWMLKFDSEAEFKSQSESNQDNLYDSRLQNSSRLSAILLDSKKWQIEMSREFEYTGYDNRTSSVYGYRQHESRLRLEYSLGDYSDIELLMRYDQRNSYDSVQQNFDKAVAEVRLDHIGLARSYQGALYFERKNYLWYASDDDYYFLSPYLDATFSLSEDLELAPRIDAQYYDFDIQNLATFSHWRVLSRVELKYHASLLSTLSFGLERERFASVDSSYQDQDFQSVGLLLGYENLNSRIFSISLDSKFGKRDYSAADDEFYTDHWFVGVDILGDVKLTDAIRLSIIGSTDFEYHEQKEDDVFVYLLSGNLTYQIK